MITKKYVNVLIFNGPQSTADKVLLLRRSSSEQDYPLALSGIGGSVEVTDEDGVEVFFVSLEKNYLALVRLPRIKWSGLEWLLLLMVNLLGNMVVSVK